MSIFIVVLLSILFVAGLFLLVSSIARYNSYVVTRGKVVDYLKCNPEEDGMGALTEAEQEPEGALIIYTVRGEIYNMPAKYKKAWRKADAEVEVEVFYNPLDPKEARLREGTPYLGGYVMAAAATGILLVLIL